MLLTKRHYLVGGTVVLAVTLGVGAASMTDRQDAVTVPGHPSV